MVDVLFTWAEKSAQNFLIWLGMVCNVLAYLYPEISNQIGLPIEGVISSETLLRLNQYTFSYPFHIFIHLFK